MNTWEPIATIPQTLEIFLVVSRYGGYKRLVTGFSALKELCSDGSTFYIYWFDLEEPPLK
jgi:hypothetical protein